MGYKIQLPAKNSGVSSSYYSIPHSRPSHKMVLCTRALHGIACLAAAFSSLFGMTTAASSGLTLDNSTNWHGSLEAKRAASYDPSSSPADLDLQVQPRAADSFTLQLRTYWMRYKKLKFDLKTVGEEKSCGG
jgi:hypothetical protein